MGCDSCASGATITMPEIISFLEYLNLHDALKACVEGTTQSQAHIKPLHRHFSMRLVIEGGFMPDDITPCPPFNYTYDRRKKESLLLWDETRGSKSERTVIGGVKTKQIDIVVTKPSLGPVMAFLSRQHRMLSGIWRIAWRRRSAIVRTFTSDTHLLSTASITQLELIAVRRLGYIGLSAARTT